MGGRLDCPFAPGTGTAGRVIDRTPKTAAFPSTRWSRLLAAEREPLEELAAHYWRPVAAYVRARWARTDEDALDATQEFFAWIAGGELLQRADPARGRFRAFLKTALANFVRDLERARRTLRRGGDRAFVPLAAEDGSELELPDPRGRTPEEVLDEAWRAEVVGEALARLGRALAAEDKTVHYEVFRDFYLGEGETVDYASLARRHGISKVDVSNRLMLAKRRFRTELRRVVQETVGGDEDLRAELAWLTGTRPEDGRP